MARKAINVLGSLVKTKECHRIVLMGNLLTFGCKMGLECPVRCSGWGSNRVLSVTKIYLYYRASM